MKRIKILFIIAIILIIIIVSLYISLPYIFPEKTIYENFNSLLKEKYSLTFTYKKMGFSLLHGIAFSNINIYYNGDFLFKAHTLALFFNFNIRELIRKGIGLDTLVLIEPKIIYNKTLQAFITAIKHRPNKESSPPPGKIQGRLKDIFLSRVKDFNIHMKRGTLFINDEKLLISGSIEELESIDGTIQYKNTITHIRGNMTSNDYELEGEYSFKKQDIERISMKALLRTVPKKHILIRSIQAELLLISNNLGLPNTYFIYGNGRVAKNIKLKLDVTNTLVKAGISARSGTSLDDIYIQAHSIQIKDYTYEYFDCDEIYGMGSISNKMINGSLFARNVTVKLPFLEKHAMIPDSVSLIIADNEIVSKMVYLYYDDNTYSCSLKTSYPLKHLFFTVDGDYFSYNYISSSNSVDASVEGDNSITVSVSSTLNTFDFKGYIADSVKAHITYTNKKAFVENTRAFFKSNPVSFGGIYTKKTGVFKGSLHMTGFSLTNIQNMDLEEYLSEGYEMNGIADTKSAITYSPSNLKLITEFTIKNARLRNFFLQKKVWKKLSEKRYLGLEDIFTRAHGTVVYLNDVFNMNDIELITPSYSCIMNGSYSDKNNYDFKVKLYFNDNFKREILNPIYPLIIKEKDINLLHIHPKCKNGKYTISFKE
ncbi:hypothetical protein ACFL6D_00720 [Spirochaetota bacterium]